MSKVDKKIQYLLKSLGRGIHMHVREKEAMRSRLQEYIRLKPIKVENVEKKYIYINFKKYFGYKFIPALLIIILLVGSGGAVAFASELALPGDTLYGVKEFIEESKAKILISDEAKINWAEQRAKRREQEAKQLAKLGRLNENNSKLIENKILKHKLHVQKILKKIEKRNPAKAKIIKARLHKLILTKPKRRELHDKKGVTEDHPSFVEKVKNKRSLNTKDDTKRQGIRRIKIENIKKDLFEVLKKQQEQKPKLKNINKSEEHKQNKTTTRKQIKDKPLEHREVIKRSVTNKLKDRRNNIRKIKEESNPHKEE